MHPAAAKSLQSCPTLCDPMDYSPPGSSVHGIFRARVLEWGAIAFSESCTQISFFFFKLYIIVLVLPNQISFKKIVQEDKTEEE